MNIDLRTALLLSAVVSAGMSAILLAAHRAFPKSIGGLRRWGIGALGFGLAGLLFSARGLIAPFFSIVLANMLMLISYVLWWQGTRALFGLREIDGRPILLALAGVMACLMYWTYIEPSFTARTALITALASSFYAAQMLLVGRRGRRRAAAVFFIVLMGLGLLSTLARVLGALLNPDPQGDLLVPSMAQSIYLVAFNLLSLLHAVGFFLLATTQLADRLAEIARTDPLTGALNRRAMADSMRVLVAIAARKRQPIAALVCDLDHFKRINDTRGHDAGDTVLRHFTQLVLRHMRTQDLFVRLGGEEFALLMLDADEEQALTVAQRLHACLNEARNDEVPQYTASWGVASLQLGSGGAADSNAVTEQLLGAADRAAYAAKQLGRNRVVPASASYVRPAQPERIRAGGQDDAQDVGAD